MPRIDLPCLMAHFGHDSFTSIIHNNHELSNVQKLCYLKASLKGKPTDMLRSLKTIEANYNIVGSLFVRDIITNEELLIHM